MGAYGDHAAEVPVGEGVVVDSLVQAYSDWFWLGFLSVVDLVQGVFPEV